MAVIVDTESMTAQYRQYREEDDYDCDGGSGTVRIYDRDSRPYAGQRKYVVLGVLGVVVVVAVLGFLCGYLARPAAVNSSQHPAGSFAPGAGEFAQGRSARHSMLHHPFSAVVNKEKIHYFIR